MKPHLRALLSLALALPFAHGRAQSLCDGPAPALGPSRDLHCIELVPAPGFGAASGRVALGHPGGPFTVAVTPAGALRHAIAITLAGLPAPASLGPYATYVAWAATPLMDRVLPLGAVGNGHTRLATVDLDKFIVLVTAERSGRVAEPTGRLVLRGASPSTRLQPPEIMQFALGASRDSAAHAHTAAPAKSAEHHGAHGGDTLGRGGPARWTTVPMPSGLQMLPAEMALRPSAEAWLPRAPDTLMLPAARPRELVRLRSGDTLRLVAGLVSRTFKGRAYTMYGFNGQYPGPLLEVSQGAVVVVELVNALDQPTAVHWHGLRLDNANDGVPGMTQDPVAPGARFVYRLRFPDAGIYWYHPHVREDAQQDLGLYGNILVRSARSDHWPPAHREEVLMLDDLLVGDDGPVPYGRGAATHALMGRFGNVFLMNGEPAYRLRVRRGEVVRFLLTNVSNTRTFNLSFVSTTRPAAMRLVAGDVSNFERVTPVESVVLAPAERYVVHVRFDEAGEVTLVNRVQALDHLFGRFFYQTDTLGVVSVGEERATPVLARAFDAPRTDTTVRAEVARAIAAGRTAPRRALVLTMEDRGLPFLTRQLMQLDSVFFTPVEWSGTMPSMNWASTSDEVRWVLLDPATGKQNMRIDDWRFRRGQLVRLTLANERRSFHAMQHPIHLHGQRFLVLAVNGVPTTNRAWKDTVLVPAGSAVELLVEMSNPGRWMLHCHIAEHLSADMMMGFVVE